MKPSSAKAKGRKHQQWTVKQLLDRSPSLEPDDITSRSMGAAGEDILMSPAARKLWPISIECKSKASFSGYALMGQAEENAPDGIEPIVVVRANHKTPMVLVDAEYFFDLMKNGKLNGNTKSSRTRNR